VAEVDWTLNLPAPFEQRVRDRNYLDQMGVLLHPVETQVQPAPQQYSPQTRFESSSIRLVRHQPPPEQMAYWRELPSDFRPLRGFKAALEDEDDLCEIHLVDDRRSHTIHIGLGQPSPP
jgi:hypothetical protein